MKGLLLKDWYVARRYCRMHLAVIAIMAVATQIVDTGIVFMMYPMLFAGYLATRIQSIDEASGWERFQQTMPLSRAAMVTEKYVLSLIAIGAAALLVGVAWALRLAVTGGGDWRQLCRMLAQLVCFGCLFPALTLPPMFRFGVEKGRVVTLVVLAALMLLIVLANMRTEMIAQPDIAAALGWHVPPLVLGTAALLALSWVLTVKLYEGREL